MRTSRSRPSTSSRHPRKRKDEPMAEGVIPLDKRGRRNWESLSDDQLVQYVQTLMRERGITGRTVLKKTDPGLYSVLSARRLLGKIGFDQKRRDWSFMSDNELVLYTKSFMKERGKSERKELQIIDESLYVTICRRGPHEKIGLERKNRNWLFMSDDELVLYTRSFMKERGIDTKGILRKNAAGLYKAIEKRRLFDKIGFNQPEIGPKKKRRKWLCMSDDELVRFARSFLKEKGISGRTKLSKIDFGLYFTLLNRNLLSLSFSDLEKTNRQSLERELLSGLAQAPEAMEKFGEGK